MAEKVFWFSRYALTQEQLNGLKRFMHTDNLKIEHVSQTVTTAGELIKLTPHDATCIAVDDVPFTILVDYFDNVFYHLDYDYDVNILVPISNRLLKEDGSVEIVYYGWEVIDDIKYKSHIFK